MSFEQIQKDTNLLLQEVVDNVVILNDNILLLNQSIKPDYFSVSNLISIASVILIIIGWRIIYKNAKKISTRSETKSIVDDSVRIISDLENTTLEYWLSGRKERKDNGVFVLLVSAKIETLSSKVEILRNRGLLVSKEDLASLSTYITLDSEKVDTFSEEYKRELMQAYLNCSNEYTISLYKVFQEKYSPVFSSKYMNINFFKKYFV